MLAFELSAPTWDAAYDEESGHLALTTDTLGISVYDMDDLLSGSSVDPKASWTVAGLPAALCFKRTEQGGAFYSTGLDSATLHVHDSGSLDQLTTIEIPDSERVMQMATASDPLNPWIYCVCKVSDSRHVVSRVNVQTKQVPKPISLKSLQQGNEYSPDEVTLTPDGKTIYFRQWNLGEMRWGTLGFDALTGEPFVNAFTRPRAQNIGYAPDPTSRWVATWKSLYDAHLQHEPKVEVIDIKSWFQTRAIVAGYREGKLVVCLAGGSLAQLSVCRPRDGSAHRGLS